MKQPRRIFVWTVLLVMFSFVSIGSTQAAAKEFKDVPKNHPNYEAIQYLQEKGFIGGYPDGTFRPQENISRKHVAKLLDQALKLPQSSTAVVYKDVPKTHPYYGPIMKLTAAGIFSGGTDGYFNPEAPITRIQMAKVLDIAFDLYMTKQNSFYDVYIEHWGYTHANALKASGVASGYPDGEFRPNDPVTRAHYSQFLYAAIKVKEARPATDKVTKGKAWDLVNRRTFELEKTMRDARMNQWRYSDIKSALRMSATKAFVDGGLKGYYNPACVDCYMNVLPYINNEPLVRFEFTQPDSSTLNVNTIEFQNGYSVGGFVAYQFKKQDNKWKMNSLTYTKVGTKNFQLTINEAKKVLEAEFITYGHKNIVAKYVTTTQQVELDPVTDAKYTFDQYTFNLDSDYGRFKVKFNSSDGYTSFVN
ncbi:hypothetical protein SporoP37_10965 [Sporosarcina sp. P37]|uniref:S-layer homology domain-containing protein n=1 Tax=unclassified Sporosarcina TaxID=2647733 RepID=UPI000A17C055|nr:MULTISPECIES: S-layer homology domain-containing protein [unclassified Sporosarcina]ARK25122.1 hypothetical protein SporoP37_10965 [Sporosarcina sp. P37]